MTVPTTSQPGTFRPRRPTPRAKLIRCAETSLPLKVPMVSRVGADYLLRRGYKMDSFMAMIVIGEPLGRYGNGVLTGPPFFVQLGSV
jgi:hypothetical protein